MFCGRPGPPAPEERPTSCAFRGDGSHRQVRTQGAGARMEGRVLALCIGPWKPFSGFREKPATAVSLIICASSPERDSKLLSACKSPLVWKSVSCIRFKLSTVEAHLFTSFPCWRGASDPCVGLSNDSMSPTVGAEEPCPREGQENRSTREDCRHGFGAWRRLPDH